MKAVVATFNQEKALVGASSVIYEPSGSLHLKHYYRQWTPGMWYIVAQSGASNLVKAEFLCISPHLLPAAGSALGLEAALTFVTTKYCWIISTII